VQSKIGSEQESVKMLILRGFLRCPHSDSQQPSEDQNRERCRKFDNSLWKWRSAGGAVVLGTTS
jgi:hypothetical protein